ncbi:hypothetical protein EI164_12985 [Psychrobacter sp. FME13]|uniref:hypothetical protein n=1 Tax=Psychrobacter sp. FME13 TaxID=2487708 RepID=UPI0017887845|nr:hypothetical protein [Psychrobacter sp. FME13]MBE0442958.1 hypothetical protein [Psychrobacter sp. FME13]
MTFYSENSDEWYFSDNWRKERHELNQVDVTLLTVDKANTHPISELVIKGCSNNYNTESMKPRIIEDYHYYCIPYELGEEIQDGLEPETIISKLINDNLRNPFFIASTNPKLCCFGECSYINDDVIWGFSSQHIDVPFLIFDDKKEIFALIDYDLPLQIIGYKKNIIDNNDYIKNKVGQTGWNNIFNKYSRYSNMPYIFKEYYKFLLPKNVASFLDSVEIPAPNRPPHNLIL